MIRDLRNRFAKHAGNWSDGPIDRRTGNRTSEIVDTIKFVDMMMDVKFGRKPKWVCPFCGGSVGLMEQENGHTLIGCDACDMRISLDDN